MAHELAVWLFDDRVGFLSLKAGRLSFCYEPAWLAKSDAAPLSCSLPLRAQAFDDIEARAFFAGLLPEGQLRTLIAQQVRVSGQNDFALLRAIGGECAGAIRLLPVEANSREDSSGKVAWLDERQLQAMLDELPQRPMLAGRDGLRLSLAGAQDKLPVVFDGSRIGLPQDGYPSTHILKPAIRAVAGSVINKGFCLALARELGLSVANAKIERRGAECFLLVERYDRTHPEKGKAVRLHQEDFCQALGVVPEMKYQNEGGPDLADCFALLRRVTRPSAPEVLRLLDYVVFNALIGNHDAHAKNFSLLYSGLPSRATPVLAPLYDVLSTAIYPNLSDKMAMKLGGRYKFSEVELRHWEAFFEAAELGAAQSRKRVIAMAGALPQAARELQATPIFAAEPVVGKVVGAIERRAALTLRRLAADA